MIRFFPDTKPTPKALRQFAALWLIFFGALAGWQAFLRGEPTPGWILLAVALSVGPLGLVRPLWIAPVYITWTAVTFPIGWLVSHLWLAVVYFGLFTPLGFVLRLRGRDPLGLAPADGPTYWSERPPPRDAKSYLRQF